jgi:membrane-bound metal-dependent hydrolase YbcI (DUF457 family)
MTSPEHTLVGIHLVIAAGAFHRYGLPVVILAGVASNLPDLDGLPMLYDMARFEAGHRVWMHNLCAIGLTSALLAILQYRFDWVGLTAKFLATRIATNEAPASNLEKPVPTLAVLAWAATCQLLHLPCDMVVSGGGGLADWLVRPWWPFSNTGYIFPMIPWGDVGPTLVLMSGLILGARFPVHLQKVSLVSLLALIGYLTIRHTSSN